MMERIYTTEEGARAERRTNLFVSATLSWPQGFAPATLRNLSTRGALIEASVLPAPGTSVHLSRGSLQIEGEVVWCKGRRAGLRFTGSIVVTDWLPHSSGLAQAHVDQMVHAVKAGLDRQIEVGPSIAGASRTWLDEAAELRRLLELVAEGLADDSSIIAKHGEKLQLLDMARQKFERLSANLSRS